MHRIASVILLGSLCEIMTACGGGSMSSVGRSPAPLSVSISPTSANVPTSQTRMFTANVQNDTTNKGVTWSLSGNGCTGIACGVLSVASSNSVSYTAPSNVPFPAVVTLLGTAVADNKKNATVNLTIFAAGTITVAISPALPSVNTRSTVQMTATVGNDPSNSGVTWSLVGPANYCSVFGCGGLAPISTASGTSTTYSAPSVVVGLVPSITITARSVTDATVSASVPMQITCGVPTDCIP